MTENATPSSDWLDRFFESYYEHRPVNATFVGRHHLDHMLPDLSEDGAGDALADMDALLRESSQVDENGLSSVERLDLRLARGFLGIQGWEYRSHHFHGGNPSVYTGEAVFGLMSLFLSGFAPLSERMASAVERLRAVPTLLASCMANVREAPREWTARAVRECDGGLAFLEHGMPRLIAESGVDSSGMEPALAMAAKSFADLRSWLETELGRRGVDRHACGEEALERYVRQGHFLRRSLDEIVAYAKEEKAEASGRLERLTRELGHADVDSAWAALARRHPTTDAYYEAYATMWDHMRATAEAHHLLTWPDFPIRYAPRPEWTREAAPYLYFLFYRSPAAFDRPPVHDYLVTPIEESMPVDEQERLLRASNDSVIKLNHVVHHGGIGHHVQNWHAFRAQSRIGQVAAVDCASRIAMFCGGTMAEGWACYATDLMGEFGGLTALERLAELQGRIRMCCRAIADVELHRGRCSMEQVTRLYVREAGMSESAALAEAVKNSMFPGAALMYLMGADAIHDLRREMKGLQGADFSLRRFHDDFLSYGSVPVSLIAEDMLRRATDDE